MGVPGRRLYLTPTQPNPAMTIETEREDDGRWVAEVVEIPGVLSYGASREDAAARAKALALRAIADRLEHGEDVPDIALLFAEAA